MRILSIHNDHDASCCIYNDGKLEKYFLVERFTRIKHDFSIMNIINNISKIIKHFNYDIDYIILSDSTGNYDNNFINKIKTLFKSKLIISNPVHHENHAYISFFNSGFDESLVVVADGSGSKIEDNMVEVESVFTFNREKNTLIYKNVVDLFSSWDLPWGKVGVGGLYEMASILIGNTPNDCGKSMGLSSYGSSNKSFEDLFLQHNPVIEPIKKVEQDTYQLHADFCYEVQIQTQKAVGDLIEKYIKETGIKNVCISGGYGMNIVANYYYLQRFPDVEFYFEPLCNDSGLSIGTAMSFYSKITNKTPIPLETTSFHGLNYNIKKYKGITTSIKDVANLLIQNKSVAVYTGLAEAGQRALGNRSILFNALNPDAKDLVNKIKNREWYRPFACMVLEEDASIYFDMGRIKSSPFMTICFPVRLEYVKVIPGVTHIDNTCRIQTVSNTGGYLYELLQEFKKLSGHGILLNTSFNLSGEPLVETPEHAFDTLNNSCLDYLWFEETRQLFKKKIDYV